MQYDFRSAIPSDIGKMRELLLEHGPNDWNYLPPEGVEEELADVASGRAIAVLVEQNLNLVGFAIAYDQLIRFPAHSPKAVIENTGYIGDVVVHRGHSGKGLGAALLKEVKAALTARGIKEIHIDCHEENAPSRGMMRKAGFTELSCFYDPDRRSVGSRKTWIGKFTSSTLHESD